MPVGSPIRRIQLFDVVRRAEPTVVDVGIGTHQEQRADVGDGDADRLRAAQGAIRRGNNHLVDVVAIKIARQVKVRCGDKSQYARGRVDRELRRVRSASYAVSDRLHRQIGVGGSDRGHGRGILRNADAGRRRSAVTGDDRSVVIDRRDRKVYQHTAICAESIVD